MTAPDIVFPALCKGASRGSADAQKRFWWTIRGEYFLLFCVAVASGTRDLSGLGPLLPTLLLIALAGIFGFKVYMKPDRDWYRCRALAESVKTSTWRFSMRAHPFGDAPSIERPKAEFRNFLKDILKANQHMAENFQDSDADQITASMLEVRELPLEERIEYYVEKRIDDQRDWYSRKSEANRNAFRFWTVCTLIAYVLAIIILNAEQLGLWTVYAFGPLIVVVTSAIGWLQMKRHSELTASYSLTAHEIGIISGNSDSVSTEEQFSEFVNETELAFSREHTQWVARREAN